jgi:uncharacterized protein YjbI with pentapeptide repeats
MEPSIPAGKHVARGVDITGSRFENVNMAAVAFDDVNLAKATFENVNLSGSRFHDINFSDVTIEAAQIGGATFRHIGGAGEKPARQRGVTFADMQLCDSTLDRVDLSGVKITNCHLAGMTIDGVKVTDLIAAHQKQMRHEGTKGTKQDTKVG